MAPLTIPEVAVDFFARALRDVTNEQRGAFRGELRWRIEDALVRREVVYLRVGLEPEGMLAEAMRAVPVLYWHYWNEDVWSYKPPFTFNKAILRVTRDGKEPTDTRAAAIADIRERVLTLADSLYEHDITEDEHRVLSDKLTRAAWDLTPHEQRKHAPELAGGPMTGALIRPHETAEFLLWVAGDAKAWGHEELSDRIVDLSIELRHV